jgi:hypothetical protein
MIIATAAGTGPERVTPMRSFRRSATATPVRPWFSAHWTVGEHRHRGRHRGARPVRRSCSREEDPWRRVKRGLPWANWEGREASGSPRPCRPSCPACDRRPPSLSNQPKLRAAPAWASAGEGAAPNSSSHASPTPSRVAVGSPMRMGSSLLSIGTDALYRHDGRFTVKLRDLWRRGHRGADMGFPGA